MPSKNYSQKTREEYGRDVEQLVAFLSGQGIEYVEEIVFAHLHAFSELHRGQGLKNSTRARKIFSIKVFFGYLSAYGYIGRNPADQLIAPDVERFPARPVPIEKFEQRLAGLSNPRDRAMLLLLATTKIRQKELVALTLDDLELSAEAVIGDTDAGSIAVTRSSGRHRFTIDYRCWLALKQCLVEREEIVEGKATTERSVLLNHRGSSLSPRGVRYALTLLSCS